LSEEKLKKAMMMAINAGYQIDEGSFSLLRTISETGNPEAIMQKTIERANAMPAKPLILTRELLGEVADELFPRKEPEPLPLIEKTMKEAFYPYAKEIPGEVTVIEDPGQTISPEGSAKGFLECFRDRFKRTEKILRERFDARFAISIRRALNSPPGTQVKVIGMVTEKREQRRSTLITIEDLETSATVLIPPTADRKLLESSQRILLDQVICVNANKGRNNLLIATELIWPDIPDRKPNRSPISVYAAFTSDLHIGSRLFTRNAFDRFILWLNGKWGDAQQRELAGRIKYVVIAGDIVDGIGVYPEQEKELAIPNIFEQYQVAASFIDQIPDYIRVIIIPGNHDAARQALPQTTISKKYAGPIYSAQRVTMLGNPARIQLHGVNILIYHGRSLEDVIGSAPNLSYDHPEKAMELLLKARHLAPIYGKRTPIAPEPHDHLVIKEAPDIFHVGHVHVNGYTTYRGTLLVNSGAWQTMTDYQRKMGTNPTPGRVPIINLQTLELAEINFMKPD